MRIVPRSAPHPAAPSESQLLRRAFDLLRGRLPSPWSMELAVVSSPADAGVDAEIAIHAPDGEMLTVLVQVKRLIATREVPFALEALRVAATGRAGSGVTTLLVARYLAPATRERIAAGGSGYADATGNLLVRADRPAVFLHDRGDDRDPWRGPGRPRSTLQGPAAARVVRALIDFAPPYTAPELAARAGASTGATYRVVGLLEEEELLTRNRYGPITDVRWRALLERWSRDYGLSSSDRLGTFLEPRGLPALERRLAAEEGLGYVVTGSLAAERFAPYAPARLASLYVRDLDAAAKRLDLRPVAHGANVVLAETTYDVVFERAVARDGLRLAAPSQVAVDLLTGPGRAPSEAEALLDWMEADERAWRR